MLNFKRMYFNPYLFNVFNFINIQNAICEWCAWVLLNDEIGKKCMYLMVVIGTLFIYLLLFLSQS